MKILNLLKSLFRTFRPTIKKRLQTAMDKRQPEDTNAIIKVLDKYDLGLSGEVQEQLINDLHNATEMIILRRLDKL